MVVAPKRYFKSSSSQNSNASDFEESDTGDVKMDQPGSG